MIYIKTGRTYGAVAGVIPDSARRELSDTARNFLCNYKNRTMIKSATVVIKLLYEPQPLLFLNNSRFFILFSMLVKLVE